MNLLKLFLNQVKAHPIAVSFFIFGYSISVLMLSVSTSNMITMKNIVLESNDGISKNSVDVSIQYSKDIRFDDMISFFRDISPHSKVRFSNIVTYFDSDKDKEPCSIIGEYFTNEPEWKFPVIRGRYYTETEILQSKKVALVGKNLKRYICIENGVEKIKIGGEIFDLIGIIGDKNRPTPWDSTICTPITAIPASSKINYFNFRKHDVVLMSSENNQFKDLEKIRSNIMLKDTSSAIYVREVEQSRNIFLNLVSKNSQFIMIAIVITILSIINMINLTSFWISDRKNEIAIRKAFGVTNVNISILLFTELLSITFITALFCIFIQYLLSFIIKSIYGYYLIIYKENYEIATLISLATAGISAIIPILKAFKVQPVEALRN